MSEPFLGEVVIFAGNFAPRGWAFCEGQLLPISQYSALFSILGTMYGGDGRTTFALPDLRGRTPVGPGNGPGLSSYREGEKGGRETVTMTVNTMAQHNHTATTTGTIAVDAVGGSTGTANGNYLANSPDSMYGTAAPQGTMHQNAFVGSTTVNNTGNQQPVDIRQPWLAIYYIIALQGIFPSRS